MAQSARRFCRVWRLARETTPFDGDTGRVLRVLLSRPGHVASGPTAAPGRCDGPPVSQCTCVSPSSELGNVNIWLTRADGKLQEIRCTLEGPPPSLTVLFLVHPGAFNAIGGGQVQLLCTVRELAALGVRCLIADRLDLPLDYDILHVWALDHFELVEAIERLRKPKVVSTIYWNYSQLFALRAVLRQVCQRGLLSQLERQESVIPFWPLRYRDRQFPYHRMHLWRARLANRRLVRCCDVALPNCDRELEWLRSDFGLPKDRAVVVTNAVDAAETSNVGPDLFRSAHPGIGEFVISAGRIEENKNQLLTILALKRVDIDVVLAGRFSDDAPYYRLCRQAAGESGRVHFLGALDRDVLFSAFAAARAHVLPSWSETPGLANIEAALCGCPLVCGNIGAEGEYFGDDAFYCNPASSTSIGEAVTEALASRNRAQATARLSARIRQDYTWRRAAEQTLAVYNQLCGVRPAAHGPVR